ncbi:MFS transporter [Parablautia muri]|uniref:MFS transporter n=1 Tax=Parablautia muri TaxID=2320879 RepID=A0A9X5BIT2_9FIRM|nr:glycoside-pentoside-hexuronide (GPH):cation symporter [Parablautia muri]NBJ94454.1 MFS transporter [Parablautia muri]
MEEKRYLKWYNKVGYGSGDLAANCIYGLLTSFVMIYLTDTVGLNAGIIGTLIMFSKFSDGITDVFFGTLIDKTHTKLGKARPWMLWSQIGNCILLVAVFAIPQSLGETAKYAYFFIAYTLLNAVFYTANNIAYASLTSLITKNGNERVQMGSIRFMFSLATNLIVASITVGLVQNFGGGAAGWRTVAIIYAVIALIVNTISVFSVKELPPEELSEGVEKKESHAQEKIGFVESFKLLAGNKYFLMIAGFYILMYVQTGIAGIGIYYMTYVLGNPAMLGTFSMAQMLPMVIGLAFTPMLVKKFGGMYKVNFCGYCMAVIFRLGFVAAGYMGIIPLMLACSALGGLCTSPVTGDINALISAASDYTVRTKGKHIEGAMFSCSSLGIKLGSGIGSAISGWLLAASGYVPNAAQQSTSAINMLNFMYLWFPMISVTLIAVIMYFLKVEKANADWDAAHGVKA